MARISGPRPSMTSQVAWVSREGAVFRVRGGGGRSVFRVSELVLSLALGLWMCHGCLLFSITRKPKAKKRGKILPQTIENTKYFLPSRPLVDMMRYLATIPPYLDIHSSLTLL